MALATLSIDLVAQLASLQEGMDKAGRLAERQANEIEARYARLTEGARAFGAAIGGAISVAGLAAFFRTTVNGLDALNDLKDATGSSIENISALEDIAARTGTSFETVASGLVKFNKVLAEAEPDSQMARTLRAIGLSAEELRGLDPSQALLKAAIAIDGYAESGRRARLIQELFGKSTKEFAPFLKDLAEAGELNAKVTTQQAEEAEKFNKELSKLAKNATDAARGIASELLPAINNLFAASKQEGGLAKMLGLDGLSGRFDQVIAGYKLLGLARERITPLSILEKDPTNAGALAELARIDAKAKEVSGTLSNARRAMLGIGESQAGAGRGFINPPLIKPDAPVVPNKANGPVAVKKEQIDENTRSLAQYVDQLQRQLDKTVELTEKQKALDMLKSIGVKGDIPQVRELVLGLAEELDLREKSLGFAKAMTAEMERQTKEQEGLDTELARFAGRIDDARKQALTARLESRLNAGDVFSPEELDRIVKGISGVKEQVEQMDEFTKQFANSIQSAFGDTLEQALSGNFSSIGKLWASMLVKMASQAVAADLTRALFPSAAGGSGSGVSSVSGLISLFGGFFGGGRALGGPVQGGRMYEVAEGGMPELLSVGNKTMLLMGKQSGSVSPAGQGGSASTQAPSISTVINVAAGPTRGEVAAGVQMAVAASEERTRAMLRAYRLIP